MRRVIARLAGSVVLFAACCHPTAKPALPSDLPPPEYETPRAYDLGGPKKDAAPAPAATTAPATTATPTPAPPTPPSAPTPKG